MTCRINAFNACRRVSHQLYRNVLRIHKLRIFVQASYRNLHLWAIWGLEGGKPEETCNTSFDSKSSGTQDFYILKIRPRTTGFTWIGKIACITVKKISYVLLCEVLQVLPSLMRFLSEYPGWDTSRLDASVWPRPYTIMWGDEKKNKQ